MINITVKKRNGSYLDFSSRGHAGYAEEGQDIVCAAVSALIITTVNSLDEFTEEKVEVGEDVKDASVTASVVENGKAKKVIVYKYKRKTGYHKKNGHRQQYTKVKIEKINA